MENLLIKNAQVVTPNGVLKNGSVSIANGKITNVGITPIEAAADRIIDADGAYLIPGIVDVHTDALEVEIVPRHAADFPIRVAFYELEKKMAACGITTVYHSLHLGYKKAEKVHGSKYSRREIFEEVYKLCQEPTLINNKIHLRFEITGPYHYDLVMELISNNKVHLVSLMDHTPGQGQFSREEFIKLTMNTGVSEEDAIKQYEEANQSSRVSTNDLQALVNLCKEKGIKVASHDDDTADKVNSMEAMGVDISEFPVSEIACKTAINHNMDTIGGGANVLRGGSLSGNLNVQDAIEKGLINCLSSDYYPPSLIHSVFKLKYDESTSMEEAVKIVSTNPAKSMSLNNIGSIEPCKSADIVIVNEWNSMPVIKNVLVNGVEVISTNLQFKEEPVLA